jgi:hypothetical protein
MGNKYIVVLKMWKKDTTKCLDVVRLLPTVPCFPHTSTPWILRSTIYIDKTKVKANIQAPKTPSYKTQELSN